VKMTTAEPFQEKAEVGQGEGLTGDMGGSFIRNKNNALGSVRSAAQRVSLVTQFDVPFVVFSREVKNVSGFFQRGGGRLRSLKNSYVGGDACRGVQGLRTITAQANQSEGSDGKANKRILHRMVGCRRTENLFAWKKDTVRKKSFKRTPSGGREGKAGMRPWLTGSAGGDCLESPPPKTGKKNPVGKGFQLGTGNKSRYKLNKTRGS